MLRMIEGLDTAKTAEVLGLGEDAVRQRLHRAREMLQADIRGRDGTAIPMAFGFLGRRCSRVVANVLQRLFDEPLSDATDLTVRCRVAGGLLRAPVLGDHNTDLIESIE